MTNPLRVLRSSTRLNFILACLIYVVCVSGCRTSTQHTGARSNEASVQSAEAASAAKNTPAGSCAQKPSLEVCCEALIPSCNDCRSRNQKAQEAWAKACEGAGKAGKMAKPTKCSAPPVSSCCGEDTEDCRACRVAALESMMAWRHACAEKPAHACEVPPPQTACCEALTPACDACRDRNKRVMQEWQSRCGQ